MAFLDTWAHTVQELPIRFNSNTVAQPCLKQRNMIVVYFLSSDIHVAICPGAAVREIHFASESLSQLLEDSVKLQHHVASAIADCNANLMLAKECSDEVSAHMRSVHGKGAGAWIQAIPWSDELVLNPSKYRLAAWLHLGLRLPFQH